MMSTSDLYSVSLYVARMLSFSDNMNEKDYVKVIKVFFQLQFLLTKLIVSRCYGFLEKVTELQKLITSGSSTSSSKNKTPMRNLSAPSLSMQDSNGSQVLEKKRTLGLITAVTAPLDTVKAGLSLTGRVASAPMHACSYAANLSWNVVSKVSRVSRNLIRRSSSSEEARASPSRLDHEAKRTFVRSLLQAKEMSGKTFAHIAEECCITNVYCAQLFHNQAQLKPDTAVLLKKSVPWLTEAQLEEMCRAPMRMYDPHLSHEPNISQLNEAVLHYGETIKALVNEECGDGVISTADFFVTLDHVRTSEGEERVVISFNGKFEPHVEQRAENSMMVYDNCQ